MSPTGTISRLLAEAARADLEDWGPLSEATGEPMATHGVAVWEEGQASAGIWEGEPGVSHWVFETTEGVLIVAGRMTITPDGGERSEIGAGDVAVFPAGWTGTWEIHETVRKVYSIF